MKRLTYLHRRACILLILTLGIETCEEIEPPTVLTGSNDYLLTNIAGCGGYILNDGGATITSKGICWSTFPNPTISDDKTNEGDGNMQFHGLLEGLTPATTYFARAYATNRAGTGYGDDITFTTLTLAIPTVTTRAVYNETSTSFYCDGTAYYDGGAAITDEGFCWSTGADPSIADNKISVGQGLKEFATTVSGLTPYTTYQIRAYATNSVGTGYGNTKTITTLPIPKPPARVNLSNITEVTTNGALLMGYVSLSGQTPQSVVTRGFCWSSSGEPSISNDTTVNGSGSGPFKGRITDLKTGTFYYVTAYALYNGVPEYGNTYQFKTVGPGETVTDIDGNIYNTVIIGNQTWMAENLKVTRSSTGISMTGIYTYNDDSCLTTLYGKLYEYSIVKSVNICPSGWHVPTYKEWETLREYLLVNGYNYDGSITGNKLAKSLASASSFWVFSDVTGSPGNTDYPDKRNQAGFNGLPVGCRTSLETFEGAGSYTTWWSSTAACVEYYRGYIVCDLFRWGLYYTLPSLGSGGPSCKYSSIRCIKN